MDNRGLPGKLVLASIGTCLLLVIFETTFVSPSLVRAQSSATEDWEKAAGGRMSFEVASVKPSTLPTNGVLSLATGFSKEAPGGLLRAVNQPLSWYVGFAYKLDTDQEKVVAAQMPPALHGAKSFFDLEARTPDGIFTTDQKRLMMQSLLAERFKLAAHFETKDGPAYAFVLSKVGKPGSQMRAFPDGFSCSDRRRSGRPSAEHTNR